MGRQLAAAGEDVAVVALDTATPPERHVPTDLEVLAEFVIDLARGTGVPLPDVDLDALQEMDRDSLEEMALDVLIDAGAATPDMRADLRFRMRTFEGNYRAALSHEPGRFDGPMVLIIPAENHTAEDFTGWACLAPALERRTAGGDHYSMLRAPHLTALAATLRDALDEATQRNPDPPSHRGRAVGARDTAPRIG
jgi:thioesterase domain-containing protein